MGALSLLLLALFIVFGWTLLPVGDRARALARQRRAKPARATPARAGRSSLRAGSPGSSATIRPSELWRAWTCFAAFALFWTWVVRRSHAASLQRVLLGFVAAAGRVLRAADRRRSAAGRRADAVGRTAADAGGDARDVRDGAAARPVSRTRAPLAAAGRALCCAARSSKAMRSIPLLAVLFIAATLLPMFLPQRLECRSVRARRHRIRALQCGDGGRGVPRRPAVGRTRPARGRARRWA